MPFIPEGEEQTKNPRASIVGTSRFIVDETPTYEVKKKDALKQAESILTKFFPGKQVGQAIGTLGGYALTAAKEKVGMAPKGATAAYDLSAPSTGRVLGDVAQGAATIAGLKAPVPATALGRIVGSTALGATMGGTQSIKEGEGDVVQSAAKGALVGAAGGVLSEGIRFAVKGVPKLLSYTSDTPESVLQRNYDNPEAMAKAKTIVGEKGIPAIREQVQGATRELRKNLSAQWNEGLETIVNTNSGKRVGLTETQEKILNRIVDEYGIDVPMNTKNMSVKEVLELNKNINELYSKFDVNQGAKGIFVRKFSDSLDDTIGQFGGAKQFLKNYGAEKQVFDNVNQLVRAYKGGPISNKTVEGRLAKVFNENSIAYLSALKELEDKTGLPILNNVAAIATDKVMPKINLGGGVAEKLIKTLLLPLTSPRGAALFSRISGRIGSGQAVTTIGEKLVPIMGARAGENSEQ